MAKRNLKSQEQVEQIKRLTLIAMVSDDDLMEQLVLKGGNAIGLIHGIGGRASKDLDFSLDGDFRGASSEQIEQKIRLTLERTFAESGFRVFDVRMETRPETLCSDVADFWGGYRVEFKIIDAERAAALKNDMEELRRNSLIIAGRGRFYIDISKFEFCAAKQRVDVDGYTVYVYTPEMITCEKLRALCQQMPEYAAMVHDRGASARARDFYDLYLLIEKFRIDIRTEPNRRLLQTIFAAKRVSLHLLSQLGQHREFHRPDYQSVVETVPLGTPLKGFDYYFDYVIEWTAQLESLWVKEPPLL